MSYSVNTHALSINTAHVINGSKPYLTFDNGVTKVTTTESLLGISLSDGTHFTPATNSSETTPIVLPDPDETLADIQTLVPSNVNSIALSTLIGSPYNYWGDDDGDGQGANGVTIIGDLKVSTTDRYDQKVSRSAKLDICMAPYKVILTSTDGSLITQYGAPNSSSLTGSSTTYYINPKADPKICYARPNLSYGTNGEVYGYSFAGPIHIWNPTKGFLLQSNESSSYDRNFPTTGANNLYFDLLVTGNAGPLTWPTVTMGGITATMTANPPIDSNFNPDGESSVRVTLTGPVATTSQISSASPNSISTPSLPQKFEIAGYDSNNKKVVKYGFVLKQWFVNRGNKKDSAPNQLSWCSNLEGGYRLTEIKDLTNMVCSAANSGEWCQGAVGAEPQSAGNYYQRNIGAGFFAEWGMMYNYKAAGFSYLYWTSNKNGSKQFDVGSYGGDVYSYPPRDNYNGVCTYP